jgi:hypothetical protein
MGIMPRLTEYFQGLVSEDWHWDMVGIDLLMVVLFLVAFKYTLGWYSGVSVRNEVAEKDNFAFGIVVGSLFLSFFLIMSAATTGSDVVGWKEEIILMVSYGFSGTAMLLMSKIIFDKFSMRSFCVKDQLEKGNLAIAIVDSGNAIATALIVFTYMSWVKGTDLVAIEVVLYGWVLSQIVLFGMTLARSKLYKSFDGESLVENLQSGNIAVAIRFAGYRLSVGLAALVASSHFPYDSDEPFVLATLIFITSILIAIIIKVFTAIVKKAIFWSTDFNNEINKQKNVGMAWIEVCFIFGVISLISNVLK